MTLYTIGYGGRKPEEFVSILRENGICAIVDIRLRPDRASMGAYTKANSPDKGIEKLLAPFGIVYFCMTELGNVFRDLDDWQVRYGELIQRAGDLLVRRLAEVPRPYCLMCAERRVTDCHRKVIADFLTASEDHRFEHLE